MNKSLFVAYEQAKLLKELGFNEPCITSYDDEGLLRNPFDYNTSEYERNNASYYEDCIHFYCNSDLNKKSGFIAAPLKSQVFKWFRDVFNVHCTITLDLSDNLKDMVFVYDMRNIISNYSVFDRSTEFATYEEAEDACLHRLLVYYKNNIITGVL